MPKVLEKRIYRAGVRILRNKKRLKRIQKRLESVQKKLARSSSGTPVTSSLKEGIHLTGRVWCPQPRKTG